MWTKKELKSYLGELVSGKRILRWALTEDREYKKEYYFIKGMDGKNSLGESEQSTVELDQERAVEAFSLTLTLFVSMGDSSRQGGASCDLNRFEDLKGQVESLLSLAQTGDEKSWEFPVKSGKETEVKLSSVSGKEDLAFLGEALKNDLMASVNNEAGALFNSAELFCIYNETSRELSNGFQSIEERSKIYAETCFSYKNEKTQKEDEYLVTQAGVHPEQIHFDKLVSSSSKGARHLTEGVLPKSGNYTVMIDSKVLVYLFTDVLSHLDAASEYYRMPFSKEGAEFVPGFTGKGYELKLNPFVDYATASGNFDSYGLEQKELSLIKNNVVQNHTVNSRMSQYLNKPSTSSFGCVEILPEESYSLEEMYRGEEKVLEIHQFSGLFTSADDLTFSSEIRLGKLIDLKTGEFAWIRGGSLSGNFKENFVRPVWSQNQVTENLYDTFIAGSATYKGPEKALIHNVSISS